MHGARKLGDALSQSARQHGAQGLGSHDAGQAWQAHADAMDPQAQGKFEGSVHGQAARKAQPGSRTLQDPVERFAKPLLHLDTPASAAFVTPSSLSLFAGQDTSLATQGDVHFTSAHAFSRVSGQTTSLYTHAGGIQAITASGAMSLRAHTDSQQIWADQDITVQSTTEDIRIQASGSITLTAGQSQIQLKGGDITFMCPGTWTVKAASHDWSGGGSGGAALMSLPDGSVSISPQDLVVTRQYHDGEAIQAATYEAKLGDGRVRKGVTDASGKLELSAVPPGPVDVRFAADARAWAQLDAANNPAKLSNKPTESEIDQLIDKHDKHKGAQA